LPFHAQLAALVDPVEDGSLHAEALRPKNRGRQTHAR